MADYNVQMKQYNGTSFDNILPYASQALTLAGGGGATEIIAQARAGLSQIATGSYVGTGINAEGNFLTLTFPFAPKMLFVFSGFDIKFNSKTNMTVQRFMGYSNEDEQLTAVYAPDYVAPFSVWIEGMTKSAIYMNRESGNFETSSLVNFAVSENSISMSLSKADPSSLYDSFRAPDPEYIFNKSSNTYPWIAFA